MASTNNCSEGKSREHYISEAILKRFDTLTVSGMPWQPKGESKILPTSSLVVNVLCERHNSALAPIDQIGLNAFDALTQACDYAINRRCPGRAEHYLITGEGLELWLLKLAAAIHFGGIAAAEGNVVRETYGFPINETVAALTSASLPIGSGLWVGQQEGIIERAKISVGPLVEITSNRHIGVQVHFGPIQFFYLISPSPETVASFQQYAHLLRPRVIDFVGPDRDARVVLSWPGTPSNRVNRCGVNLSCE